MRFCSSGNLSHFSVDSAHSSDFSKHNLLTFMSPYLAVLLCNCIWCLGLSLDRVWLQGGSMTHVFLPLQSSIISDQWALVKGLVKV